jgi:sugar (pentulose or hexulose) kinase
MEVDVVLDVGKTLAKLAVFDDKGKLVARGQHRNAHRGRYLDTEGIAAWLPDALARMLAGHRLRRLVPVAHGAGIAILDGDRLWCPISDYEHQGCVEAAAAYSAMRDPFAVTGSPCLSAGLNLGRQLHWLETERGPLPTSATLLPLAQYWGWWLTGVAASEVSSLGCHTDLWDVVEACPSPLAVRRGWAQRFAPLRPARAVLGPLRPDLADRLAARDARVLVGAHDSNAALLAARGMGPQGAAVLSTGTWFVVMAPAGARVMSEKDCLVNIDVDGRPVPSARWMGGRFLAEAAAPPAPSLDDALGEGPASAWRTAAVMAARLPAQLDQAGPLLVEGRFAAVQAFMTLLATLHPGPVHALPEEIDVARGGLWLARPDLPAPFLPPATAPLRGDRARSLRAWAASMAEIAP